jgi:hypothetical protein
MGFLVGAVDTNGHPHVVMHFEGTTVLLSVEVARDLGRGLMREAGLAEEMAAKMPTPPPEGSS